MPIKDDFELQTTTSPFDNAIIPISSRTIGGSTRDDDQLRRLGKRPLLNRGFGFMSILGFSCSALLSWEGILVTSISGLLNGGPAGVVWGFLINWIGTISVYTVLGELASSAPTAGGQYHWVAMMAPKSSRVFLSYMTAWMTTLAWQALAVSVGYIIATMLQGIIVLTNPSYVPENWHTVLIIWAATLFAVMVNSTTSRAIAKFEGAILILHLAGFFGVLVPMVYFAPHNDPKMVFTTFFNTGGWSTQGLSFFVGFPAIAGSLLGADCAVHMSEEIQSAALVVPRALLFTILINGSLAFAMAIALMFCLSDVDAAMEAATTMFYPFLEIFYSSVGSITGACIMACVVFVMAVASSVGVYASASRMMWSFSRDRGLPFDRHLVKLNKSALPVNAILTTLAITVLLSLIVLGSAIALNALLSLAIAALFSSYLLVCGLLLWRRTTGAFQPYDSSEIMAPDNLIWGPWKLPEPLGVFNNVVACLYSILLLFWSFWPQTTPTTPENANWSILVWGAVVIFSIVWYMVRARHYFTGPIREV
ncbi:putative GABA transporter [Hypoxylon fragiforme]|uniref:putative GABA transporter n=1 Tax=Hypoxylon fragiforme TaxID=63214 RepID=UPI0020C6F487|nr:putative GABA transporter [Hypoxylon fragiforme]KAI2606192.1 putative GABA transporter [Hypoxylon fragiforme]